jgi:hypothetical protein
VLQHARDELAPEPRQAKLPVRVVKRVALAFPDAQVDVAAAARLVGEGLGGEAGHQPMLQGHGADRVADHDLAIRRGQNLGVLDRELLLGRPELRVVLARLQPLAIQGIQDIVDDVGGPVHAV